MNLTKDEQETRKRLAYEQSKLAHMSINELNKNKEFVKDDFDSIDSLKASLMPFPF